MAGLPYVVSDVGDLADLVVDGQNGWRLKAFSHAAREAARTYAVESMSRRWDRILGERLPAAQTGTIHP
jgi:hypothetical protein